VSGSDLGHLVNVMQGEDDSTYIRSNVNTVTAGAGFVVDYNKTKTNIDLGFVLLSDAFDGNYGVTLRFAF
jgi:hypothetical protein